MYYYYQDVIARLLKNHKGIKKLLVVPIIIGILMLPYAQSFLVYGQSMVNSLASEEPASDEVFVETNTIEIEHRELESIITTTGIIKSDIETTLASKNPGRITQVYFDTGDRVQKGQVIARLGGEEHSAQLQMAQNAYSNTNDLYTHSQSMYEQQVKNAENQVLTAQANLGALEVEQQNLEEIRKEQKAGALIQYEIAETYEDHIRDIGHEEYDASPPEMQGLVDEKYDLEIENAELQLDYADSQLDLLDVNLNAQANTLNAQIDVAETYLRQAEDGVITAERQSLSQLQMIKTQLDNAQDNIALASVMVENNVIRAPYDGIITDKFIEIGQVIGAGQPLMSFANDGIIIQGDVADIYAHQIHNGQEVRVIMHTGTSHVAEITQVSPKINAITRRLQFEMKFKELPEKLLLGEFVDIEVISGVEDAYIVPREYIYYDFEGPYVLLDDNNKQSISIIEEQYGNVQINFEGVGTQTIFKQ